MRDLSNALQRYARQISFWGLESQEKLASSTVLVAGLGGLGSAVTLYLVAAGVGRLILVDSDSVSLSDLNRQVLHWTRDIGRMKVDSAAEKLHELNPGVEIERMKASFKPTSKMRELVRASAVVVDCLDNWKSRLALNEVCVKLGKSLVHASIEGMQGHLTVVAPGTPCLKCIFKNPPDKASVPVIAPIAGILGAAEALETLKLITGYGKPLTGKLLVYDGFSNTVEVFEAEKRFNCPVCSRR
ncbi:MAG: HesA/MoeB/ThiF family protein [Thermofilaceae archaeon]